MFSEDVYDEWVRLYADGFTTREIGDIYNVSKFPVTYHLKRKNVGMRENWEWNLSKPHLMDKEPTYEQKQVILGSTLGDGTLCDQAMGAYLRIKHKEGQKEYLKYKFEILGEFISLAGITETETDANGKTFQQVYSSTVPNMYIKILRRLSYVNGKRVITDLIPQLDALGLAILWCDDGHFMVNTKAGKLFTMNFSWEDNELLCKHLKEKFQIECSVKERYVEEYDKTYPVIYVTTAGMRTMKEVIKEYIPPSMKYKIGEGRMNNKS
jgi:hypothetical protein